MSSGVNVTIHASQFPDRVRHDLLESLRLRKVNHKFHYDSIKQTNRWLALHQKFSPSRRDADCAATYDRAFQETVTQIRGRNVQVVGLGCGGGQKDTRLLKLLASRGRKLSYTPSDVSVAMALVAQKAACQVVPPERIFPLVCDLATIANLNPLLVQPLAPRPTRLITFFGMIPNFEPDDILPRLARLVRRQDTLLFSANLAPGGDYAAGTKRVLPQYDNPPTREWLLTFLRDLGVESGDGELRFEIETRNRLHRVVARFHFRRIRRIMVEGMTFEFGRSESIRLFFSYRYTPELVRRGLAKHRLKVLQEWITKSGEEGVFLCRRQ